MPGFEYMKPLPEITPDGESFWKGTKRHELLLPRCNACGKLFFYPRSRCVHCFSTDIKWEKVTGKGSIFSYTIVYRTPFEGFDVPYVLAVIKLDEGPMLLSNVIDCEPEKTAIGDPVEVIFEDVTEEITLPKFRVSK